MHEKAYMVHFDKIWNISVFNQIRYIYICTDALKHIHRLIQYFFFSRIFVSSICIDYGSIIQSESLSTSMQLLFHFYELDTSRVIRILDSLLKESRRT